ncbi:MAG: hypothetical protein HY706_21150 [Candidatus Hydrogenedentes bacterium]|nr:hypothetical protein [Candidatus Hydrogenedentota bacterium]
MLRLDGPARACWEATGLFVFDNAVLSADHAASLVTVLNAIPKELHAISAIIVPAGFGVGPSQFGLVTTGQLLYIPAIPMAGNTWTFDLNELGGITRWRRN